MVEPDQILFKICGSDVEGQVQQSPAEGSGKERSQVALVPVVILEVSPIDPAEIVVLVIQSMVLVLNLGSLSALYSWLSIISGLFSLLWSVPLLYSVPLLPGAPLLSGAPLLPGAPLL